MDARKEGQISTQFLCRTESTVPPGGVKSTPALRIPSFSGPEGTHGLYTCLLMFDFPEELVIQGSTGIHLLRAIVLFLSTAPFVPSTHRVSHLID